MAQRVFLPHGFPHTVTDDYVPYQIWDTLQAFASSLGSALATEAVLKGAGVGDAQATPLAATITWLLKDGTGMLGRIAFAYTQGTSLDCDCKRWRLAADVLNDCALVLSVCAAALPRHLFTYCMCAVALCHSVVGVAGGATRAAVTQHQARRHNLADVSAKDGSQETMVNLAALLVSLVPVPDPAFYSARECPLALVPHVSGRTALVWLLLTAFVCVHVYANYRAVRALCFDTFNQARLEIVCREYALSGRTLEPAQVNAVESVAPWRTPHKGPRIELGVDMDDALCQSKTRLGFLPDGAVEQLQDSCFLCLPRGKVFLSSAARPDHIFLAACVAVFMQQRLVDKCFDQDSVLEFLRQRKFVTSLKAAGWRTDCILMNDHDWKVQPVFEQNLSVY